MAKLLTFTAAVITGREAVEYGLVTKLSDRPYDDAMAVAAEIARHNPVAARGAKALLNRAHGREPADQFAEERRVISSLIGTPNQIEAVKANFEKRAPVFNDT